MTTSITTEKITAQTVVALGSKPATIVTQDSSREVIVTGLLGPPGASSLEDMTDLDLTDLDTGSMLLYSADSRKWVATPAPTKLSQFEVDPEFISEMSLASVSTDSSNALRQGTDGKLLVDDVTGTRCLVDFSTIYQLSK
jgi:hypothetical protein